MPTESQQGGFFVGPPCDACGVGQSIVVHEGVEHYYCPQCNEPMPTWEPDEYCTLCEEEAGWIDHHTSYIYNTTILVCRSCHGTIHSKDEKYEEYEPVFSRVEAVRRGIYEI